MNGGLKALFELKLTGKIKAIGIGCNGFDTGSLEVCKMVGDAASELEKTSGKNSKALD